MSETWLEGKSYENVLKHGTSLHNMFRYVTTRYLEENTPDILEANEQQFNIVVHAACALLAEVVDIDGRERRGDMLNFLVAKILEIKTLDLKEESNDSDSKNPT
jgi:hypothetical protein